MTASVIERRGGVFFVVLLGSVTAVGPLSLDMYLPALPAIADEFAATESQIQLSLTACLLGLAAGQLVVGPLSDRWGRRRPVIFGTVAYALATLLCALAPTAATLTAARLVQGIAGGVGVVVARAVVRDLYAGAAAAKFFSKLVLVFGLAPVLAPSLGSVVLRFADWRWVFVTLTVIGALLAAFVALRMPETLPPERRVGGGLRDWARLARRPATDRRFIGYALTQGLAFAALFAYISGSSFVLQEHFGASSTTYGLLFGLNAVGLVALGQVNAVLVDHFTTRQIFITALAVSALATGALVLVAQLGNLWAYAAVLFVFVASIGLVFPNGMALALDRHAGIAGTASALLGSFQSAVGALAAPVVGLVGSTATGMAAVMAVASAASLVAVLVIARPARATTAELAA